MRRVCLSRSAVPAPRARHDTRRPGGLYATATDYARFLIEVVNPKPADAFRLTADSLQMMTRPVVAVPDDAAALPGDPRGTSWALGWQVVPTTDGSVIAHGGDVEGSHSFAVASVSRRSGYVVMTNGENGWKLTHQLITAAEMHRLLLA